LALPPGTSDEAFLREVDEEVRRDQAMQIWQRYGRWIIGAVVAGLLVFAGYLYFQSRNERNAGKEGEAYAAAVQALQERQESKAGPELAKLAKSGSEGYRALALFAEADLLAEKQDLKGAAAKYSAIAADTSLPQPFRDEALLRQTSAEFDTLKPEVVIDRLKGLAAPGSAWFGGAGEMVAAAYLKQGKRDAAGKLFADIAKTQDPVPDSIRQRAVQMAGVLGVDAIDQTKGIQKQ
jgi:hypothetical protein